MKPGGILIVDDDHGIIDGLTTLFEDEGYQVCHALNGCLALEHLRSHGNVKLVLLDLMMPVMDGYVFRELQLNDVTIASIPVIILTAGAQDTARLATMKCENIFKKPVDIDLLLETAQRLVFEK